MRRLIIAISILVAGLLLEPRIAAAHAFLDQATPGADAKLTASPAALKLEFTEPLEGDKFEIVLYDLTGHRLASNADKGTAVDFATVTIPVPKLAPGDYRVTWHVNPGPGHETSGDYHFTILPGS
jgi:methionine-rich copper-binding protein CopC